MSDSWPSIIIGPCRICRWESLLTDRLCMDCKEIHEQSAVGRALCNLIHRGVMPEWPREEAAR